MRHTAAQVPCSLNVNGDQRELGVRPDESLLDVLRDRLGLKGTRRNCDQGECGACTVLLDGEAVNSCLVLAASANGHSVTTVEALRRDGVMDPLQRAFLTADASQCGFCTPGFLMAAKGLLNNNPEPTAKDVRDALSGNYCRCTGYKAMVDAICVTRRAENERQPWEHAKHHVLGETVYIADMSVPNMVFGAFVALPVARAAIEGIDVASASGMPGVVGVFTAADFGRGGVPRFGPIVPDQYLFASVRVHYRELPAILTREQALSNNLIHDPATRPAPQARWADSNVMQAWAFDWGDPDFDAVVRTADVVVENTYEAPFAHHFHLEPYGTICVPQDDGVYVMSGTQHPFVLRRVLGAMLGLDQEKVRVKSIDMGGGFGGKGYPKIEPAAAACCLKIGRAIKITLTAEESFRWGQREASHIRIRSGFTRAGDLVFRHQPRCRIEGDSLRERTLPDAACSGTEPGALHQHGRSNRVPGLRRNPYEYGP
jgi:aerobic-type carbon monoxide dehydrogenase small subunit (CoxS/CutS family)